LFIVVIQENMPPMSRLY